MICCLCTFETCQEIEDLSVLEETSLSSDLSQGFALKSLTGDETDVYFFIKTPF